MQIESETLERLEYWIKPTSDGTQGEVDDFCSQTVMKDTFDNCAKIMSQLWDKHQNVDKFNQTHCEFHEDINLWVLFFTFWRSSEIKIQFDEAVLQLKLTGKILKDSILHFQLFQL